MKQKKRFGWVIVAVLLLILPLIALGCTVYVLITNDGDRTPSDFTKAWMSYIDDGAKVKEIAIPGSHDTGTYSMLYYGKTQDLTVAQQLDCGVRYLDLRVQKTEKGLVIFHSILQGAAFEPILKECREFLEANPSEMLVLDFQHFIDSQDEVVSLLKSEFEEDMFVHNASELIGDAEFINGLTLGEARGKCLVFWGSQDEHLQEAFIFRRNNDAGTKEDALLHSYYIGEYNKKSSAEYIEQGLALYIDMYREENSGLFVLQGQLTDGLFVFGPRFRECTHYKNMEAYVQSLADSEDLSIVNIVMRDFVNSTKSRQIISLNYNKGLVKEELVDAFLAA